MARERTLNIQETGQAILQTLYFSGGEQISVVISRKPVAAIPKEWNSLNTIIRSLFLLSEYAVCFLICGLQIIHPALSSLIASLQHVFHPLCHNQKLCLSQRACLGHNLREHRIIYVLSYYRNV